MSKPLPPKQNFIQTLLFTLVIFLGFQMIMGRNQAPVQPSEDLRKAMVQQNEKLLDVTIAGTFRSYSRQLDEQVKEKKITEDEALKLRVEAAIITADTQLKAGLKGKDTGRVRDAYATLVSLNRKYVDTPVWTTPVSVPQTPGFGFDWTEWSGQTLYVKVVETLSSMNKTDLVYGVIPGYQVIDVLVRITGSNPTFSYAFAAFLLALIVRASIFKLAQAQYMSGRKMSQLMPLVKEIKEQYKDDQVKQNQKVMELYKEYGVNPFAGCGPALIQMPLFITIYQCMLHYQFEFQKGYFLWINPVTSKNTNGFTAPNLGQEDWILILIYGVSMLVSTLLTPVSDPTQARQQRAMGIGITVLFTGMMFTGAFPVVAGFVLYWVFTNFLATAQALRAYRMPLPPLQKVNAAGGGVYPKAPTGRWGKFMEQMQAAQEEQMRRQQGDSGNGNGKPQTFIGTGEAKKGTPAKHKPKKRK